MGGRGMKRRRGRGGLQKRGEPGQGQGRWRIPIKLNGKSRGGRQGELDLRRVEVIWKNKGVRAVVKKKGGYLIGGTTWPNKRHQGTRRKKATKKTGDPCTGNRMPSYKLKRGRMLPALHRGIPKIGIQKKKSGSTGFYRIGELKTFSCRGSLP